MRSCLAPVCLFLVLIACATAAPAERPAFDPAAADTVRTNLWVARALFTDIAREAVASVPGRDQGVSLRARGTHDALPLLETALYAALQDAGHRPYLDESDDSGALAPITPDEADYEIRYRFETCQLDYPAVGRRFGLWRNWIDREVEVSALVGVVDLSSGRLLLDDRIERRFNDRVPADFLDLVDESTYAFTTAVPADGGIRTIMEELVVIGALTGLVAIYFTNTGN
ncbi:hypothetical protein H8E07_06555 [bacterium]|nr:hypothetical protein [bacterium]